MSEKPPVLWAGKVCARCKEFKAPEHFWVHRREERIWLQAYCKPCCGEQSRDYKRRDPESYKEQKRWAKMLREHGITRDQYEAMNLAQDGRCAICRCENILGLPLAIDHCHATGRRRELLCNRCNGALGLFGDNPELAEKAAAYIRRHQ